jgi:hypothetical protein
MRGDIERDPHLVAEQRSACLERLIPGEAEISAVEHTAQLSRNPLIG